MTRFNHICPIENNLYVSMVIHDSDSLSITCEVPQGTVL